VRCALCDGSKITDYGYRVNRFRLLLGEIFPRCTCTVGNSLTYFAFVMASAASRNR